MAHPLITSLILFAAIARAADFAQVRGGLQGRVLDASGASVPNVRVDLAEAATNIRRQTTSSESGDYSFRDLNPGEYRIEASAPKFEKLVRTGVVGGVGPTAGLGLHVTGGQIQD